jgi:hypothetical protein
MSDLEQAIRGDAISYDRAAWTRYLAPARTRRRAAIDAATEQIAPLRLCPVRTQLCDLAAKAIVAEPGVMLSTLALAQRVGVDAVELALGTKAGS